MQFQKPHQDRGGNIIRKIGAHRNRCPCGLTRKDLGKIHLHDVTLDHRDVIKIRKGLGKHGNEAVVDLNGDHLAVALTKGVGQGANAGADL